MAGGARAYLSALAFASLSILSALALLLDDAAQQQQRRECASALGGTALWQTASDEAERRAACRLHQSAGGMRPARNASLKAHYTREQLAYLRSLGDDGGGDKATPARGKRAAKPAALRQEVRTLTGDQWQRLVAAMAVLKERRIDGKSEWDLFVSHHKPNMSPGGHFGPAFLPWHREYLHRFENALRQVDAGVSLPYWDTRIDARLPNAADSALWTGRLFGNGNGHVVTGPFAYWRADEPMSTDRRLVQLNRALGGSKSGRLPNAATVGWVLKQRDFKSLAYCDEPYLEMRHGWGHLWVGGYMRPLYQSPNDPVFFFYHAFIDYIWERFRRSRQSKEERENDYGSVTGKRCEKGYLWAHALDGPMHPFGPKRNRDGLSDDYTRLHYAYAPSPDYCNPYRGDDACAQSEYTYCDRRTYSCTARVQPGGNCTGLDVHQACYESVCNASTRVCDGYLPPAGEPETRAKYYPSVWFKVAVLNGGKGAEGRRPLVTATGDNYNGYSRAYVGEADSFGDFQGQATIRVARPSSALPLVKARLRAYDSHGRACEPLCLHAASLRYRPCNGTVALADHAERGQPVSYSLSRSGAHFAGLALKGHPAEWMAALPSMAFACGYTSDREGLVRQHVLRWSDPSRAASALALFHVLVLNASAPFASRIGRAAVRVHDIDAGTVRTVTVADSYDGLALVTAANPYSRARPVQLNVTVTAGEGGKRCTPDCGAWADLLGDGSSCSGYVQLHRRRERSRPRDIAFTTWPKAANYLGWDMRAHRRSWTKRLPIVRFRC